MKFNELLQNVCKTDPGLEALADQDARRLLRGVFTYIRQEIENTGEGSVKVPGLGQFRVRPREQQKEGKQVVVKHIVFRPAEPK